MWPCSSVVTVQPCVLYKRWVSGSGPAPPQGDPYGCCQCWAHLHPVQHLLHPHLLPICTDRLHLQPVPAAPLPPTVLQGKTWGSSRHWHPTPRLPSPMGQGLAGQENWGTAGPAKGPAWGQGAAGAMGSAAIPLARQGPGLAWGQRCPQPWGRKGAQRTIEALPSPAQSPLLTAVAPRPQLWPEGASKAPTSGLSAGHGPMPSGMATRPSALAAGSASPVQEGALAPGHPPLLPSAAFSPPASCCLH